MWSDNNPIDAMVNAFPDPGLAEIYAARCVDAGENVSLDAAQSFRDSVKFQVDIKDPSKLSLRNLRIGPSAATCISLHMKDRGYTSVDLSDNMLGDYGVHGVRSIMKSFGGIRKLNVASNAIGAAGIRELSEEFVSDKALEILILGSKKKQDNANNLARGMSQFCQCLMQNTYITSLNLSNTGLGTEAAKSLASLLQCNQSIQHLQLACNPIGSDGVNALLPVVHHLRSLDLSSTRMQGTKVIDELSKALERRPLWVSLGISGNTFDGKSLKRFGQPLAAAPDLVSLSLASVCADNNALATLAMDLGRSASLVSLDLSSNCVQDTEVVNALAFFFHPSSALASLKLSKNPIGDIGARALAHGLESAADMGCSLATLDLSGCKISAVGAMDVLRAARTMATLKQISLQDNFLSEDCERDLLVAVTEAAFLTDVRLQGNRLSISVLQKVAKIGEEKRKRQERAGPEQLQHQIYHLLHEEARLKILAAATSSEKAIVADLLDSASLFERRTIEVEKSESERRDALVTQTETMRAQLEQAEVYAQNHREEKVKVQEGIDRHQADWQERIKALQEQQLELEGKIKDIDAKWKQRQVEVPKEIEAMREQIRKIEEEEAEMQVRTAEVRAKLKERPGRQ
mmetsp:Transcript_8049/g.17386  ORF Transcript_8049/g.17386 Transcript_8049/m.17386 type:complete len:632 (-) Transcript_8049:79-1974(-)